MGVEVVEEGERDLEVVQLHGGRLGLYAYLAVERTHEQLHLLVTTLINALQFLDGVLTARQLVLMAEGCHSHQSQPQLYFCDGVVVAAVVIARRPRMSHVATVGDFPDRRPTGSPPRTLTIFPAVSDSLPK